MLPCRKKASRGVEREIVTACIVAFLDVHTSCWLLQRFPYLTVHSVCDIYSGMLSYLHSYASNFDIEKYISYSCDVTLVEPAADYDSTGRWTVGVKNSKTGEVKTTIFDGVLVCNGLNNKPNRPDIAGLNSFKGHVVNALQHDATDYVGKRVVVIGMGVTGCELAVEASRMASKVSQWFRAFACLYYSVYPKAISPYKYPRTTTVIISHLTLPQYRLPRHGLAIRYCLCQARATFYGRGPHLYFDSMSGATRPESFTSVIITCYSMNN